MWLSEPTKTFPLTSAEELYLGSVMFGNAPKLQYFSIFFMGGAGSTSPSQRLLPRVSPPFPKTLDPPLYLSKWSHSSLISWSLCVGQHTIGSIYKCFSNWRGGLPYKWLPKGRSYACSTAKVMFIIIFDPVWQKGLIVFRLFKIWELLAFFLDGLC